MKIKNFLKRIYLCKSMNLNQLIIKATSLKVIVERVLIFCLLFQGVSAQGQTKMKKT